MYFDNAIDCILFIFSILGCLMLAIILGFILNKMYIEILKMKNDKHNVKKTKEKFYKIIKNKKNTNEGN